ncbi:hypothetical protein [uncultured Microbacterium sp.]|uniref:hypothetical protein n=1 Tax=uncultured Microbacterium sp. TaxID=191216 RepID=UPI0026331432|nr:hypothetical protein [uncultured Microbacterium sp.]
MLPLPEAAPGTPTEAAFDLVSTLIGPQPTPHASDALLNRVPSQESLARARAALAQLRRLPSSEDPAQCFSIRAAELILLSGTADHAAAAGAADALRALIPALPVAQQMNRIDEIRRLLGLAIDAYINDCRLDDAEDALDERGPGPDETSARHALGTRAFILAMRGDEAGAEAILDAARAASSDDTIRPREHLARAAALLDRDSPAETVEMLCDFTTAHPASLEWPYAALLAARAFTATDPVTGMEHLRRLMHDNRNVPISARLRNLMRAALADLALSADDVPAAQRMTSPRRSG